MDVGLPASWLLAAIMPRSASLSRQLCTTVKVKRPSSSRRDCRLLLHGYHALGLSKRPAVHLLPWCRLDGVHAWHHRHRDCGNFQRRWSSNCPGQRGR